MSTTPMFRLVLTGDEASDGGGGGRKCMGLDRWFACLNATSRSSFTSPFPSPPPLPYPVHHGYSTERPPSEHQGIWIVYEFPKPRLMHSSPSFLLPVRLILRRACASTSRCDSCWARGEKGGERDVPP
jgi:hypothetical protein